jgi:hypothetical protein
MQEEKVTMSRGEASLLKLCSLESSMFLSREALTKWAISW